MNIIKDLNNTYKFLHDTIMKAMNEHAPIKEISKKLKKQKTLDVISKAKNSSKNNFTIIDINTRRTK